MDSWKQPEWYPLLLATATLLRCRRFHDLYGCIPPGGCICLRGCILPKRLYTADSESWDAQCAQMTFILCPIGGVCQNSPLTFQPLASPISGSCPPILGTFPLIHPLYVEPSNIIVVKTGSSVECLITAALPYPL